MWIKPTPTNTTANPGTTTTLTSQATTTTRSTTTTAAGGVTTGGGSSTTTTSTKTSLPRTGSDLIGLLASAGLAIVGGAAMILYSCRPNRAGHVRR